MQLPILLVKKIAYSAPFHQKNAEHWELLHSAALLLRKPAM